MGVNLVNIQIWSPSFRDNEWETHKLDEPHMGMAILKAWVISFTGTDIDDHPDLNEVFDLLDDFPSGNVKIGGHEILNWKELVTRAVYVHWNRAVTFQD